MHFVFDGSLEGLLCAVFEYFDRKASSVILVDEKHYQPDAFSEAVHIHNDRNKADRVWNGLSKILDREKLKNFYWAYLSEDLKAYRALFGLATAVFKNGASYAENYGDIDILTVAQFTRSVGRERHRMEAFIRFKKSADGIFYCGIDPDFNVLPIIVKHFRDRYASMQWIIYDTRRNYGLFYDLKSVEEIQMDWHLMHSAAEVLDEKEEVFADLWKDYFKSTNIPARKNTKLHIKHVPKRYWKYLTEKQPYLSPTLS